MIIKEDYVTWIRRFYGRSIKCLRQMTRTCRLWDWRRLQRRGHSTKASPQYTKTPLTKLDHMAAYLGVKEIYLKDESYRFGLNAFKVLGGSFSMARYIAKETGRDVSELPYSVLTSDQLRKNLARLPSSPPQTATTDAALHGPPTVLDRRQWYICLRVPPRHVWRTLPRKALP